MMRNESNVVDVAVVGGGMAGLLAAAQVARDGKSVVLFEKADRARF